MVAHEMSISVDPRPSGDAVHPCVAGSFRFVVLVIFIAINCEEL